MTAPAQSLKEIFLAALEVAPELRAEWLLRVCGDDAGLREQLTLMLDAHDVPQSLLDQTAAVLAENALDEIGPTIADEASVGAGTVIGPYKLLHQIGEGGMGTVYMAEQTHPVRRKVAIKVIKPGMNSRQVLARFEAERQALAMMDHVNIARVLDAGTTDGGRPYFVMELLKGTPITAFCDARRLTPRQRLELFVPVCQAIQHAHQKGIIHRDIKPSNVLVALYDDRPIPKVIDFGVAKATGLALTEQTLNTGFSVIGTPEYMSPEQATFNQLDIDTRSDIYSLGVLLYELLTGATPFKKQELEKAGLLEILRVIREDEPPRPSTRASTADALPSISASRGIEPSKLCGLLRNELDWIVMKALDKDRSRRYETANGFVADINRYLAGEAVLAHPPTKIYRLGKFLRKNKGPVLAASLIFVALFAGVIGTTLGLFAARSQRALANEQRDRAVAAEIETQARADELKLVSDFQAEMFSQIDLVDAGIQLSGDVLDKYEAALLNSGVLNESDRKEKLSAFTEQWKKINAADTSREFIDRTILKPAINAIERSFSDQPLVDAQLRQTLCVVYDDLGLYETALPLLQAALATRTRLLGEEHPDTLQSLSGLGNVLVGQGKTSEAEVIVREALEKCRRVLGDDDPSTLIAIDSIGGLMLAQGRLSEAEPYCREALKTRQRLLSDDDPETITALNNLGAMLYSQGKITEGEVLLRESLKKSRRIRGDEDRGNLKILWNLSELLAPFKTDEAELLSREALATSKRLLGAEHPDTLEAIAQLGSILTRQGKIPEAEPLVRDAFARCAIVFGENHRTTLNSIGAMGSLLLALGKPTEAEPLLRAALAKSRRVLGEDNPQTIDAIEKLGHLLWFQGNLAEAETLNNEALEKCNRVLGTEHLTTLGTMNNIAAQYWSAKQLDKSIPLFEDVVKRHEIQFGRASARTIEIVANLGVNYKDAGRLEEAIPLLEEAFAAGRENPSIHWVGQQLMNAYIDAGQLEKAKSLINELIETAPKNFPAGTPALASELAGCGFGLLRLQAWSEAEPILRECLIIRENTQPDDWRVFSTKSAIGEALLGQKRFVEAEPLLVNGYEGMKHRESTILPNYEIYLQYSLERLVQLNVAIEKPEQAAEWQKRLDDFKIKSQQ